MERGQPVLTIGGAGGKRDATRIRAGDLGESQVWPWAVAPWQIVVTNLDPQDATASGVAEVAAPPLRGPTCQGRRTAT